MTWWLWLILALGAIATFVLIGLHLWRLARRLFAALGEAASLAERLAPSDTPTAPALAAPALARPEEVGLALVQREANLTARSERRHRRATTARDRWHSVGLRP